MVEAALRPYYNILSYSSFDGELSQAQRGFKLIFARWDQYGKWKQNVVVHVVDC